MERTSFEGYRREAKPEELNIFATCPKNANGNSMSSLDKIYGYKTWRQRIPLDAEGNCTMGYLNLPNEWDFNFLPQSMNGKSFLDVGSNDGYFPFEAEKRGASYSTASDIYHHGRNGNVGGWNIEGVEILKEYFHSNVEIISKSIYDLHTLPKKYDVVLCSNVISWLDNMNEALAQLSTICNETLYLKDGFLTRFDPEPVLQYERGKGLVAFRANLSYIREVLRGHGFKKIEVKPIYSFKYFDYQTATFPGVVSNKEIDVYSLPQDSSPGSKLNCNGQWVVAEKDGFYFLKNTGWVKKNDVQIGPRGKRSVFGKLIRSILSDERYTDYIMRRGEEKYVKSYMIIAHK